VLDHPKAIKSPAFQFYPKDYLSDAKTRAMTFKQRGMYWDLVSHCWLEDGLPDDPKEIARILGITTAARFEQHDWPVISRCFRRVETGGHRHPRLEVERRKQEENREYGRQGGLAKADRRRQSEPSQRQAVFKPKATPLASQRLANSYIASPSPSASPEEEREKDALADRAGRFLELYGELHHRYRGVAYLGNPVQDYQQAQYLVGAFDDAMLEKLAVYWLNDTDTFASAGTRSLAKLRSRASKYAEELKAQRLA
jgi:uncharacterized protein YdaU (DUF1376 family)